MSTLRGGCLCGAVGYEVEDAFAAAFYCHCSCCRRATGSAFKPMAAIKTGRLRLTYGAELVLYYGTPPRNHDVHCGTCGSFLYSVIADNGNTHVAMGTLIDAPTVRPSFHMFVGSKAPWYEITDSLPQFEGMPE
ncbi:Glutathione-dependent formaldehyde-activating enzyme [Devosia equisanguinis]|uniref:Glutathione-dependent formaldehyde-activating enzyme n=1 Tax=Devosia equisanguinis TaxID=2490941 RepID=A0A3S4D519_9HYPH|nr:GFA family protein [Devosia equisanguinis]VDS04598.1 Glutathione-dependent formaldehyde-activating enzyme [Devosia equisanguinis]